MSAEFCGTVCVCVTAHRYEYYKAGITGGHFGGWLLPTARVKPKDIDDCPSLVPGVRQWAKYRGDKVHSS